MQEADTENSCKTPGLSRHTKKSKTKTINAKTCLIQKCRKYLDTRRIKENS